MKKKEPNYVECPPPDMEAINKALKQAEANRERIVEIEERVVEMKMKESKTIRLQIGWYPEEEEDVNDLLRAFGGELPQWLLDKIAASEKLSYAFIESNSRTLLQKFSNMKEMNENGEMSYLVGERMFFDFPAVRVPVECDHCRGEGKTVADNLRGIDYSAEELLREGDWDDYVSHEGIWKLHKCSRCNGNGCHMQEQIDETGVLADHAVEWELHQEWSQGDYEMRMEDAAVRRAESGGYC